MNVVYLPVLDGGESAPMGEDDLREFANASGVEIEKIGEYEFVLSKKKRVLRVILKDDPERFAFNGEYGPNVSRILQGGVERVYWGPFARAKAIAWLVHAKPMGVHG